MYMTSCEPVFIVELLRSWLLESEQWVCHTMALSFTLKSISEGKRRIMVIQIFHHEKI
jgi:hypothetical protein